MGEQEGVEGYIGVSETFQNYTNDTDKPLNTEEEAAAEIARNGGTIEDDSEGDDEEITEDESDESAAPVAEAKTSPLPLRP